MAKAAEGASIETAYETGADGQAVKRKRVVNRGARGPVAIYLFLNTDPSTGRQTVVKSFRDPRKMATFLQSPEGQGLLFLVTTPE